MAPHLYADSLKSAKPLQSFAGAVNEGFKRALARNRSAGFKVRINQAKHAQLELSHRPIFDQVRGANRLQGGLESLAPNQGLSWFAGLEFGYRSHIDIQHIEEQPACGRIRAGLFGLIEKQGVKGIKTDHRGAPTHRNID